MIKRRPPDLDHCVQVLLNLKNIQSNQMPKLLSEIYVCGIGLLYHLRVDRNTLKDIQSKNNHGCEPFTFPKSNAIPAIAAVVHNQELFRALLSSLSTRAAEIENSESGRAHHVMPASGNSRKRSASVEAAPNDMPPSKIMKTSQSPHVSKRTQSISTRPQINLKVMAASILFAAFEPFDHWPAVFVKLYAEDCFGPRSWVDEPTCKMFVDNLELCYKKNDEIMDFECGPDDEANARVIANFYNDYTFGASPADERSTAQTKERGSLSSAISGNSSSVPPSQRPRSMSAGSHDSATRSEPRSTTPPSIIQAPPASLDEDSDSGDEEEVAISTTIVQPQAKDGDSSSSGEEDEEVLISTKSLSGDDASLSRTSPGPKTSDKPPRLEPTYPVDQRQLNFTRVRQRYFGVNLDHAHRAAAAALQKRLDIKTKQNSGLLQTLPQFAVVSGVRKLITANLEKWLQSPALAGLARNLFSDTVNLLKNADPPIPDDLDCIDNILSMRLKANQLNAHIENVTAIARRIPTAAVAKHIYSHLLREVLLSPESMDSSTNNHLKMVHAVHGAFSGPLTSRGISAAIMTLMIDRPLPLQKLPNDKFLGRMCHLIHAIASDLDDAFDGFEMLQALSEFVVPSSIPWTREDEENRAMLLFHTAILCIKESDASEWETSNGKGENGMKEVSMKLRHFLGRIRKVLLKWFCKNYGRFCSASQTVSSSGSRGGLNVGAGIPNYTSILDGNGQEFPEWVVLLRSLMFLDDPDSLRKRHFLSPHSRVDEANGAWQRISSRLHLYHQFGGDVDDDLVRIILHSATTTGTGATPTAAAICILEHLVHGCRKGQNSRLSVSDPQLLWELYDLVKYSPRIEHSTRSDVSLNGSQDVEMKDEIRSENASTDLHKDLPLLAFPGLWWRATSIGLVMCGVATEKIGSIAWNENPTLRALIKMVTSDRYRFPTVDCDDAGREEMKCIEQEMRDEEARITETLFLPPKKPKSKSRDNDFVDKSFGGSRVSKRQQEKREQMLKKQREKEAHEAQKENSRRKKMLRVAQKSIMLWDPRKGARKPPKESADLIFSVGELFDLPLTLQQTTAPDFLLRTIGGTSRGAIERAYDWLIPIISFVPETINRLPASASCFLLLRAYGTEGDERAQLQELSAPLLSHVRRSLTGSFGELDAVRAFDLLLADIASHNADRRRCARRVLHDAIGKDVDEKVFAPFRGSSCAWMIQLTHLPHSASIIGSAIRHFSQAASFERGRVLRFLILALDTLSSVKTEGTEEKQFHFPSSFVKLISNRPTVFASAMGSFADMRSLAIHTVSEEFRRYCSKSLGDCGSNAEVTEGGMKDACDIILSCKQTSEDAEKVTKFIVPLALLETSCVLLSIWFDDSEKAEDVGAVESLVTMLMKSREKESDGEHDEDIEFGLVSAKLRANMKSAIPVESWVMLARSRSDFIAKRAALTAPTSFIPRLLLCSGLPRASLISMIDRLGRLGDGSQTVEKTYSQLLVPSAASEWDIGRLGRKKDVSRKLLGRLSAYVNMYGISDLEPNEEISTTFLIWLAESCRGADKKRKTKTKKSKDDVPLPLSKLEDCEKILTSVASGVDSECESEIKLDAGMTDMTVFFCKAKDEAKRAEDLISTKNVATFLDEALANDQVRTLEAWFQRKYGKLGAESEMKGQLYPRDNCTCDRSELLSLLLGKFARLERKTESLGAFIVKWVTVLSASGGSPSFWKILLAEKQKPAFLWKNLLVRCCQCWSHEHLVACRQWILSQGDFSTFDIEKIVRILIQSVPWGNINDEAFVETALSDRDRTFGFTEKSVRQIIIISTDSLTNYSDHGKMLARSLSRNNLPDGLILLLLISRLGRKQVQLVSQSLVDKVGSVDNEARDVLMASILRLYAAFPNQMNLGVAILRSILTEAVEKYSFDWISWRSPLDDYIEDLVGTVVHDSAPNIAVQALAENSKKHPLLVLRKLTRIEQCLEEDAAWRAQFAENEKRDVIVGRDLTEPASVQISNHTMRVSVKHWGYNFSEGIWSSFLDILAAVPKEVLFGCGLKMGLEDFLGAYLRLVSVQSQLLTSDRFPKFKRKLMDFLGAFKASNATGWSNWMKQEVVGLKSFGTARNVLLSCDLISHEEALQNVKQASQGSANATIH